MTPLRRFLTDEGHAPAPRLGITELLLICAILTVGAIFLAGRL